MFQWWGMHRGRLWLQMWMFALLDWPQLWHPKRWVVSWHTFHFSYYSATHLVNCIFYFAPHERHCRKGFCHPWHILLANTEGKTCLKSPGMGVVLLPNILNTTFQTGPWWFDLLTSGLTNSCWAGCPGNMQEVNDSMFSYALPRVPVSTHDIQYNRKLHTDTIAMELWNIENA